MMMRQLRNNRGRKVYRSDSSFRLRSSQRNLHFAGTDLSQSFSIWRLVQQRGRCQPFLAPESLRCAALPRRPRPRQPGALRALAAKYLFVTNTSPMPTMTLLLAPGRSIAEPSNSWCRSGSASSSKMSAAGASIRRDTDTGLHRRFPFWLLPCPVLPRGAFTNAAAKASRPHMSMIGTIHERRGGISRSRQVTPMLRRLCGSWSQDRAV